MHSKQTVKYICHIYPSGHIYYFKQEIITHDHWKNLQSLAWSSLRPVSKSTVMKRKREGYQVEKVKIDKPPADIIQLNHYIKK